MRPSSASSCALGQAVVERRVAHAGPRGAEQRGGHDRRVGLHERQALGAGAVDPLGDAAGGGAQGLVGEAVGAGAVREAVPEGVGRHLEDHGDVHEWPPWDGGACAVVSRRTGAASPGRSPSPPRGSSARRRRPW